MTPKWVKMKPYLRFEPSKTKPLWVAHNYLAHIWSTPPPPTPSTDNNKLPSNATVIITFPNLCQYLKHGRYCPWKTQLSHLH